MSKPKYIEVEAFKRRIRSYATVHEADRIPIPFYKQHFAEAYVAILQWVCEEADDTPYAEVVPERRGRWIVRDDDYIDDCKCSECGCVEYFNKGWKRFNYCPSCGARMEETP